MKIPEHITCSILLRDIIAEVTIYGERKIGICAWIKYILYDVEMGYSCQFDN